MKTKSNRLANIELLRIIAMLMVITLHYLGKGNLLPNVSLRMNAANYVAWILESLSIVAVNIYVLISGYFLVESEFKPGKIVKLICQVLFYTILITALSLAVGLVSKENLGIYNLTVQVFPFQQEQYWFMTSYLVMYILSPVLAVGVKSLSKKHLQVVTILLVCFMCVEKSILPVNTVFDKAGYNALWFICLFLVAAYIRLHGLKILEKSGLGILFYFAGCILVFAENMMFSVLHEKTGEFGHLIGKPYHYNHIFVLIASVGLFYFFLKVKIKDGFFANIVCKLAPYTLGVYLLHEHVYIRYLWPVWLGADKADSVISLLLYTICAVMAVFVTGIVVDWLRSVLFGAVTKCMHKRNKK